MAISLEKKLLVFISKADNFINKIAKYYSKINWKNSKKKINELNNYSLWILF